ncbi:MAG: hypothetical protein ABEH81_01150 [Halopenitus sp.]
MTIRIFQEEDGTYAVWFNEVDDFLKRGMEENELKEWYIDFKTEILEKEIEDMITDADRELGSWKEGPDSLEEAEEMRQVGEYD